MRVAPTLALSATVIWGIAGVISLAPVMMSPMMFDSGENSYLWAVFWSLVAFPCGCLVAIVGSWIAWARSSSAAPLRGRPARIAFALLPLTNLVAVSVAFTLMATRCGGSFNCH